MWESPTSCRVQYVLASLIHALHSCGEVTMTTQASSSSTTTTTDCCSWHQPTGRKNGKKYVNRHHRKEQPVSLSLSLSLSPHFIPPFPLGDAKIQAASHTSLHTISI